jgi:hypothetical protein
MYIIPGNSAFANLYKEGVEDIRTELLHRVVPREVCFGASIFPKGSSPQKKQRKENFPPRLATGSNLRNTDVGYATQSWAACRVAENIVFWREHSRGGHFASIETPDVLVQDIRDFADNIGGVCWKKLIHAGSEKN